MGRSKKRSIGKEDTRVWYTGIRQTYDDLSGSVRGTIESLLKAKGVEFLSVTGRAKTVESVVEKVERKGYTDIARQMTDLCGIRVITYMDRDVEKVCDIIRDNFHPHDDKSLDKSSELEVDQVGYRSMHFICDLGAERVKLAENSRYKDLVFEVQVRSVLQHAWAEIEHDRSYKFSGELPSHLKRRLHLIAGTLELLDREFNGIANELDEYKKVVAEKTAVGDLDIELNTTSVREYLARKLEAKGIRLEVMPNLDVAIDELQRYGITTISALDRLFSEGVFQRVRSIAKSARTEIGLLRDAMIFADPDKYFETAWKNAWEVLDKNSHVAMVKAFGEKRVNSWLRKYKIEIDSEAEQEK
jgi:putative GTP pyrophosphokinase